MRKPTTTPATTPAAAEPVHGVWGEAFTGDTSEWVPKRELDAVLLELERRDKELVPYRKLHVLAADVRDAFAADQGDDGSDVRVERACEALWAHLDSIGQPAPATDIDPDEIKREVLEAVDRFERNLGFTAPELWGMRVEQLRDQIEGAFATEFHNELCGVATDGVGCDELEGCPESGDDQ